MLLRTVRVWKLSLPSKLGSIAVPKLEIGHCQQCRQNNASAGYTPPQESSHHLIRREKYPIVADHHQRLFSSTNQFQGLKKSTSVLPDDSPGMLTRMLERVGLTGKLRYSRFRIRVAGLKMYTSCADGIDVEQFFRACNMKDTLFSFFLVTELHVWMCMARLKQEGREGKYMTHYMVMCMWHDIQERGKVMGISSTRMRESLGKMAEHFNAALFAYDEGLLSSDAVLAAALWRNLFVRNCNDPQQILEVVAYIRQQMQYLDTLDSSKLLQVGRIKWLPFQGKVKSTEPLEKAATIEEELDMPEFDKVPA